MTRAENGAADGAVFFNSPESFRTWLQDHAHCSPELLVGFYKLASGAASMSWSESVDQALCFGWIDGVRRRIDDDRYSIRFTPRRSKSIWSAVNVEKIVSLRAQGLMTAAGERAFSRRCDSRTRVYSHECEKNITFSSKEQSDFRSNDVAWAYFNACPPGYRRRMVHHVVSAKKAQTRVDRLQRLIDACASSTKLK